MRPAHDRFDHGRHKIRRSKSRTDAVSNIERLWRADRTSRPLCLAMLCVRCAGTEDAIRQCKKRDCPGWLIRPFQLSGEADE